MEKRNEGFDAFMGEVTKLVLLLGAFSLLHFFLEWRGWFWLSRILAPKSMPPRWKLTPAHSGRHADHDIQWSDSPSETL